MPSIKISEHIYSVGVLNPNLRVFDIIMETKYGTSYNAYIVKGNDKIALIDTSHSGYEDVFLENIKSVCNPEDIDYIILNHNEPDHSGSLKYLTSIIPNASVLASQAGNIYIKNITNKPDINLKPVKDGEILDLGGVTLKFVMAPFLHWPDSMFTYVEEDKAVFTCDFLGAHYCEPTMIDQKVRYKDKYEDAAKYYFDCIFGPFKPYVQKGLDKLSNLSFDYACPSHGPILTKEGCLSYVTKMYENWCDISKDKKENLCIPIFYCSAYGNTHIIAEEISKGIKQYATEKSLKVDTPIYNIIEHDMSNLSAILNSCDAFLVGSPTINKAAVPPVWALLSCTDAIGCRNKATAAFGSYGWSGEAVGQINAFLKSYSYKVVDEAGLKVNFVPSDEDLSNAFKFGQSFASNI